MNIVENLLFKIKCDVCGREGHFPVISFPGPDSSISGRPLDAAALIRLENDDLRGYENISPGYMGRAGLRFRTVCPKCYRLGATPEENGTHKAFSHSLPSMIDSCYNHLALPTNKPSISDELIAEFKGIPDKIKERGIIGMHSGVGMKLSTSPTIAHTILAASASDPLINIEHEIRCLSSDGEADYFQPFTRISIIPKKGKSAGYLLGEDSACALHPTMLSTVMRIRMHEALYAFWDHFCAIHLEALSASNTYFNLKNEEITLKRKLFK